jgi:hypothetical protein
MEHFDITGSVDELRPGYFIARAFATRSWEQFALQRAALTSIPVATRAEAESRLQRLIADLREAFGVPSEAALG